MFDLKLKMIRLILLALTLFSFCAVATAQGKDARSAVQSFFTLLKSQKYAELYDFLPSELQKQITREQLTGSLKRLEANLAIERMEIGRVQQRGDVAVVDATIYGNLKRPMEMNGQQVKEGRVTVQQFLFKENGQWKVATADNRSRDFFLKRNPNFKQQFQLTPPQFAFKQNGKWMPLGQPPAPPR
ncbi:MAG TPA: NTF2-like N-terminal transpeptidase domain-containing protein [Blastocatellia bacterium]|nr:NTF2-like N-terminal transpeptidase domain-containing protein [Blastocatellia bacterium]HNG29042.1 NTF2-like N-terminal transpeptidase domain-containing protein [Blastocatellia bacterium]